MVAIARPMVGEIPLLQEGIKLKKPLLLSSSGEGALYFSFHPQNL